MKRVQIELRLEEDSDQIVTAMKTSGYDSNNIGDMFELLGMMETLKSNLQSKIKLMGMKTHVKED